MQKLSLLNSEITFYIRTAKKLGFIQKSKKSVLSSKELKEITQKKTKIPVKNQILYYNGEQIKDNQSIKIVDKSIMHAIDSRNVGKQKMKLFVKRLPKNSPTYDFEVDSNTSIEEFIKKKLEPFYDQSAEKLFFVYSGRELKKQKSFSEELVESETEIVCVHAENDRKNKKQIVSTRQLSNQLNRKDNVETKTELTLNKYETQEYGTQEKFERKKLQNMFFEAVENESQVSTKTIKENQQKFLENVRKQQDTNKTRQKQQKQKDTSKKLIGSIQQIKRNQTQSDEKSDKQTNTKKRVVFPQKFPEKYLIEQTRQRSNTKSDHHNNSGQSSISEPNFKKKKKAIEVQLTKKQEQKIEVQISQKSVSINRSQEKSIEEKQGIQNSPDQSRPAKYQQKKYKTRDEIFENNFQTYSSVIDEPQQFSQTINIKNANFNVPGDMEELFKSYYPRQDEEIYDSQVNNYQIESNKMKSKGFLYFSSASFFDPCVKSNNNFNENQEVSLGQTNTEAEMKNNQAVDQISNRAPEFLASHIKTYETYQNLAQPRKQSCQQIGGDSLSFSKEQSEIKPIEESQDKLFVAYRRGSQADKKNQNIIIQENEVSEQNLLFSSTYKPNASETMNSITFNLEPNPDEMLSYSKQSDVHIFDDDETDELNNIASEKRESQIETNFKDSANQSQFCSSNSQIINKQSDENLPIEPESLIDDLMQMMEYKVNVNTVDSEQSDAQHPNPKQNFVQSQSDISYDPQNQEQNDQKQSIPNLNIQNFSFQNVQPREISFAFTQGRSLQSGFLKKVFFNENQSHDQQNQNPAIKIEDDSVGEQDQDEVYNQKKKTQESQNSLYAEEIEHSAAFHEINQSINPKNQEFSNLIGNLNNSEPDEITFRKDNLPQNRYDERQCKSKISERQNSKLLYQFSLQAMNQTQKPQLLPGDYIYSTDRVETPDEVLETILMGFTHCF